MDLSDEIASLAAEKGVRQAIGFAIDKDKDNVKR